MAHDTAGKQGARLETTVVEFLPEYFNLMERLSPRDQKLLRTMSEYRHLLTYCISKSNNEPFYLTHISILPSIYNVPWFIDFLIWHPERFPNGLVMEVKQQSVAGSVDEKYPFVVMSLIEISRIIDGPTVLFVSGGAARQCATNWCLDCERQQDETKFAFIKDESELRHFLKYGKKKAVSDSRNKKQSVPSWLA